ncbi:hypothetical protein [Alicyclobacillus acidiphilus]|nr:hypothetical protein [Alicyclobacillus acidiphilus]
MRHSGHNFPYGGVIAWVGGGPVRHSGHNFPYGGVIAWVGGG